MSTFGEELRRERELRQISLREISEATKVNIRYLEALERNDFRHLPGGVFNKGFVRAYAQYIGIDPEAMVNAYLLEEQQQTAEQPRGDGHWIRGRSLRESPAPDDEPAPEPVPHRARLPVVPIVVAAVIVAAAGIGAWWLWSGPDSSQADDGAATAESVRSEETTAERERALPPDDEPAPEPATGPAAESVVPQSGEADPGLAESDATLPEPDPDRTEPDASDTEEVPHGVVASERWTARVRLDRTTDGRVNCDNRRVEVLNGLAPGTELVFDCSRFLLIRASDGGAVMVGVGDEPLSPLGPDGVPSERRRMGPSRGEVDS